MRVHCRNCYHLMPGGMELLIRLNGLQMVHCVFALGAHSELTKKLYMSQRISIGDVCVA